MKLSGWQRQEALRIFVSSLGDVSFARKIVERCPATQRPILDYKPNRSLLLEVSSKPVPEA
jgi:hypothetical protein